MRAIIWVCLFCGLLGCATEKRTPQPTDALVKSIAAVMQSDATELQPSPFSIKDTQLLKSYVFLGPPGAANPLYYDKIKNVEKREITRVYYDFQMNPGSSHLMVQTDQDFWRPISTLARYKTKFGRFPPNQKLSLLSLETAISAELKSTAKKEATR